MEDFHAKIDAEKHARVGNLSRDKGGFFGGRDFDEGTVRKFFEDKKVNPETIADFFRANDKGWDYLEGMFPQLEFENNSEKIMSEIRESAPNGFTSPDHLMVTIAQYIKSKMSYDLLTVLFEKPGEEDYTNMIRRTMSNPNAKFGMSNHEKEQFDYFVINSQMNMHSTVRLNSREQEMIADLSTYGRDINWLKQKTMSDPSFWKLLRKLKWNGRTLYDSGQYGILRANEKVSRDVYAMLNTVRVGVCRDFAMMTKKIYEKMSKDTFPDSEAIYVSNFAQKHAYILLAYEKDEKTEKRYFDPTTFITGWSLSVLQNDTYGNEKDEVWARNGWEDGIAIG